jgi:hypothetical protein
LWVFRNKVVPIVHRRIFIIPQILTWIDIGISIGGFVTVSRKDSGQLLPTAYSRAGTAILAIIFLYTVGVFVYFWLHRRRYAQEEYWLIMCVSVCVPLLLVRVLYSVISFVTADLTWNAVRGSPTAYLLMTMVPEVAFIAPCTFTIMNISPLAKKEQNRKDQPQPEGRSVELRRESSQFVREDVS